MKNLRQIIKTKSLKTAYLSVPFDVEYIVWFYVSSEIESLFDSLTYAIEDVSVIKNNKL
jgi:hypothetical protein